MYSPILTFLKSAIESVGVGLTDLIANFQKKENERKIGKY